MGLSVKREELLVRALSASGWTITSRRTVSMMGGDVVETSLWHLTHGTGACCTLSIVTELGFGGFFPPILRAVRGHVDVDTARTADGVEMAWEEGNPAALQHFVDGLAGL